MSNSIVKEFVFIITNGKMNLFNTRLTLNDVYTEGRSRQTEFFDWNFISKEINTVGNLSVDCPEKFFVANRQQFLTGESGTLKIGCSQCFPNTYRLNKSTSLNVEFSLNNASKNISETNGKCLRCPPGGICNDVDIKARDNFHGFIDNESQQYEFLLCPDKYCCSRGTNTCNTPKTCAFNRTGRLCGKCKEGYFISLVNNNCILNSKCTVGKKISFWITFLLAPIAVALILTFPKTLRHGSNLNLTPLYSV